jgi:hypothetical protein
MILWLDLETYSDIPIACGAYKYAEGAEIILFSYAIDDAPARVVDIAHGEKYPAEIMGALLNPDCVLIAHNAQFDRTVLKKFIPAVANPRRWKDSMIKAYSLSLPGSLASLCEYCGLPVDKAKDKEGGMLVRKFCIPQRFGRCLPPAGDFEWKKFVNYARLDVEAMRECWKRLPGWNDTPAFWAEWHIDQDINDRGMQIDLELASCAIEASAEVSERSNATVQRITGGKAQTAGQRDVLMRFLEGMGYDVKDMRKTTLEAALDDPLLPDEARELITARLYAAKASVKKYDALLKSTNADGRLRGCLMFCGAQKTGRWCLTGDHEVLTPDGWVRLDEWDGGEIACWNPQSEAVSFKRAGRVDFEYCGKMFESTSKRCMQVCTPDHKMPYLNKKGFWDYDTMESLAPHRFEMPYPGGRHQMRREYTREIEFSGRVYCATTETGFFVVRRCGVVWITGNSGKIFQPQNLPRGTLTPEQADTAIGAIKTGMASILYDDVNAAVSSCLRGAIMAPPGKKLVVADLSNIEGRVLAWLAGERWKLDAFRAYDEGRGVDLYKATYARTFGIKPEEVTKKQRQVGKVLELAMGYMGGVGSFLAFATVYGVDLKDLAERTYESLDQGTLIEAGGQWDFFSRKGMMNGLDERTWTALNAIKLAWRAAHPAITDFWREIEARAMIALGLYAATNRRPLPVTFSNTKFGLACRLPSGRVMAYPRAELPTDGEHCLFRYYAPLRVRKGFAMSRTHAGRVVENITQATARDVLAANLARVEAAGYKIVLSVHDELITETPDTPDYTAEKLAAMMATPPTWAADLPLAAAGFEAYRYKKD